MSFCLRGWLAAAATAVARSCFLRPWRHQVSKNLLFITVIYSRHRHQNARKY